MYTLVLVTFLMNVLLIFWLKGRSKRKLLSSLLSFPALPFIGNAFQLFGDTEYIFHLIADISNLCNAKLKSFVVWFGPWPLVALNDVDDIKLVANTFLDKPFFYKFSDGYIGNGLITAPGVIWKANIKRLAGIFTSASNLEGAIETFNDTAQTLVDELKTHAITTTVHVFDVMDHIALRAILDFSIGKRLYEETNIEKYCKTANRTLETFIERGANLLYFFDWIYKLSPTYKELTENLKYLDDFATEVITKRKEERRLIKNRGVDYGSKTYLDHLLDLHESDPSFTEKQMVSELNTVVVAGQGTLAITLALICITLGKETQIQEKLYAEMQEIFGGSHRKIDKEDLKRMQYCEAVINEIMRLYPAVPIALRHVEQNLSLKTFTVPKGSICGLNMWAVGRSEKTWGPDAEQFRPERWLEQKVPPGSSIPFSIGKRSCIGRKYAMMVMKIILANCIREFTFTSHSNNLKLKIDVALKVIEGDLIKVELRNRRQSVQ